MRQSKDFEKSWAYGSRRRPHTNYTTKQVQASKLVPGSYLATGSMESDGAIERWPPLENRNGGLLAIGRGG